MLGGVVFLTTKIGHCRGVSWCDISYKKDRALSKCLMVWYFPCFLSEVGGK